ncbi:MAG TPA: hypothetical protein VN764_16790 [Polyangiaceae bacterium]|nr:hypothetical protein [Polyangiaceae bacterium]
MQRLNARKLLTATAGLATVSYLGTTSCSLSASSGNLMAMTPEDGSGGEQATGGDGSGGAYSGGNLMAPGGSSSDCDASAHAGEGGEGGNGEGGRGCVVR